jgi:RHS repeat-associated protein
MNRRVAFIMCVLTAILTCNLSHATVTFTVVPPPAPDFNTYVGGPFDILNLGSLEYRGTIPIMHKAGRGIPFKFDLTYDNKVWVPIGANGSQVWTPVTSTNNQNYWGWTGLANVSNGVPYISYSMTTNSGMCGVYPGLQPWSSWAYSNFVYHDELGIAHSISGLTGTYFNSPGPPNCPPSGAQPPGPQQAQTSDGSAYTIYVTSIGPGSVSAYITTRDGKTLYPPVVSNPPAQQGSFYENDKNGNKITVSNGAYTDTLGAQVLTAAGIQPNNTTFTYSSPSGFASYVVSYKGYTVKTAFGCTGVQNYTSTSTVYLVDKVALPDNTFYQFTYENTPGYNDGVHVTARVSQVTLPTGGSIQYQYTGANNGINCSDGSTPALTRTLSSPGGQWTYTRTPGTGTASTTTVTDPNGNQTVLQFQNGIEFFETQRDVYQGSSSTGTLMLTTKTCYNGNTTNCTSTQPSPPINQRSITTQYPGTTVLATQTVTSYNVGLGLPSEIDIYPYGQGTPGTTALKKTSIAYASSASHPVTSVIVHDGNNNLLSEATYAYDEYALQPTTNTPMHQAGINSGNVTTVSTAISFNTSTQAVSGWLTRHYKYYDTGQPYQTQDMNGQWTTYNYSSTGSCGNSFPTSYTLPISGLSNLASTTWNCTAAIPTASTDINGNTTTTNYSDPYFWRPASVVAPYTSNTNTTTTTFNYTATTMDSRMLFNGGSSVAEQLSTLGTFGQVLYSQQREGPSSSNWDSTQVIYDSSLRAYQSTMPCVTTSGSNCPSAAKTTTTMDALGRATQTTDGGNPTPGWVKYTYTQNDVLQEVGPAPAGENTKQKQLEYDALGRLTSVCEKTNSTGYGVCSQQTSSPNGYLTTYAYGVATINSLLYSTVTVNQNAQASSGHQARVYTYDLAGRLISEQNPETGTTNYTYDSDSSGICSGTYMGDLVKVTDARGNSICYQYDAIRRTVSITYPSSGPDAAVTPSKTFVYDSAVFNGTAMQNAKGGLVEAYTGPGSSKTTDEFFSYSVRGELTDTWQCSPHSGTSGCASVSNYYHVTVAFWENGALKALSSNVSGVPAQTYGVDSMGRTQTVTANSAQNPNLVTGTSYNLSAFTYGVTFGSGDSDTFYLDSNTGRQTKYVFNVNGATNTGLTNWNPNGSLGSFQVTDNIPGTSDTQNCSYTHDDLSRIASVNCVNGATNKWNQQFTYDAFGNITKTSSGPGQGFHPTYSSSTNWITALSGITPTTDANGRMTYDGNHNYSWDAEGKLHAVDTTNLTHDAFGRMVEKSVGSTYTEFVYGPAGNKFATMNGQTLVKGFVSLPAAVAVYTPTGLTYYRHSDHLGSSRLATSPSRTMYSSTSYAPYGEPYAQAGTTDVSFTGQDADTIPVTTNGTSPAMYDFVARKFSPLQGRWLSPDPAGLASADPGSPQSWNRYAYVLNSPMNMIDPLGLNCVWDDGSYDDAPEDGGASPSECASQGGAWMDSVTGAANYNPDDLLAFVAQEIEAGYVSTTVNADVRGPVTFGDFTSFGYYWLIGATPASLHIHYGPNDGATKDMEDSPFVREKRQEYIEKNCPSKQPLSQGHFSAYAESANNGAQTALTAGEIPMNWTQAQVGGYSGSITTSGNVTTFTINNTAGISSFIGQSTWGKYVGAKANSSDNALGKSGPGHNIQQTFQWTETGLCGGS